MRKWFVLSALVVLAIAVSLPALASPPPPVLTPTGFFTGTMNEDWESFAANEYPDHQNASVSIMNGAATISSPLMYVYQPGFSEFGLGIFSLAPTIDKKGMGLDNYNQLATIDVSGAWGSFGAYWGASKTNSLSDPDPSITVYAYDALNNLVGTDSFTYAGGGALAWRGWSFNKAVTKIEYAGDFVVIDDLQANEYKQTSAVPEPATLLGFGLPMLMVGLGKLKSLRK
jgi:hypothetical protein